MNELKYELVLRCITTNEEVVKWTDISSQELLDEGVPDYIDIMKAVDRHTHKYENAIL